MPVKGVSGDLARRRRRQILERDGNACCICGDPMDLNAPVRDDQGNRVHPPDAATFEHKRRRCDGGRHNLENLGLAHAICNRRLGDWLKELDRHLNHPAGKGRARWRAWRMDAWPALPFDWLPEDWL